METIIQGNNMPNKNRINDLAISRVNTMTENSVTMKKQMLGK
jgi:hypothetical protein